MVPELTETTVNTSALSMSPGEISQAKLCFHALTKFRLTFARDSERFCSDVDVRHIHRNVPKLLRCAVNLEYLALVAHEEHGITRLKTVRRSERVHDSQTEITDFGFLRIY